MHEADHMRARMLQLDGVTCIVACVLSWLLAAHVSWMRVLNGEVQMVLTGAERVVDRSVERSKALSRPLLTLSLPRDTGIGSRAAASSLSTAVAMSTCGMQACSCLVAALHITLLAPSGSACCYRYGRYSASGVNGHDVPKSWSFRMNPAWVCQRRLWCALVESALISADTDRRSAAPAFMLPKSALVQVTWHPSPAAKTACDESYVYTHGMKIGVIQTTQRSRAVHSHKAATVFAIW